MTSETITEPLYERTGGGTTTRPIIDLDLGRAFQYGYRTYYIAVHHLDAAPDLDLRAARRAACMRQSDVAEAFGVSRFAIRSWETGRVPCPPDVRARWMQVCRPPSRWALDTVERGAAARHAASFAASTPDPQAALVDLLDALLGLSL